VTTLTYQQKRAAEVAKRNFTTHGHSSHPLYRTWLNIRRRCHKVDDRQYHDWGGRGITMDPLWYDSFEDFAFWIDALCGPRPSRRHTLDRIDNDLGYLMLNLKWSDPWEQANNRRPRRRGDAARDHGRGDDDGRRECLCDHDCAVTRSCPWYDGWE
jgi:hypothetical protein